MVELISADGQPLFFSERVASHVLNPDSQGPASWETENDENFDEESVEVFDGEVMNAVESDHDTSAYGEDSWDSESDLETLHSPSDVTAKTEDFASGGIFANPTPSQSESFEPAYTPSPTPVMPMKVKARPPAPKRRSSPIKTLIGVAMGPLIALPLAGGILLYAGKAPNLGFWPFDGSFSKNGSSQRAAAPPMELSQRKTAVDDVPEANLLDAQVLVPAIEETLATSSSETIPANDTASEMVFPGSFLKPESSDANTTLPTANVVYPEPIAESKAAKTTPDRAPSGVTLDEDIARDHIEIPAPMPAPMPGPTKVAKKIESILADEPTEKLNPVNAKSDKSIAKVDTMSLPDDRSIASLGTKSEKLPNPPQKTSVAPPKKTQVHRTEEEETEAVEAVGKANKMLGKLMKFEGPEAERDRLLAFSYATVSAVATQPGARTSPQVARLLHQISISPLIDDLGLLPATWLDFGKRTTDGIFLVGRPGSSSRGQVVHIKTPSGTDEVILVSGSPLPSSNRVVALGVIRGSGESKMVELVAVKSLP